VVQAKLLDTSSDSLPVDEIGFLGADGRPKSSTRTAPQIEIAGNSGAGDIVLDARFGEARADQENGVGIVLENALNQERVPVTDPAPPTPQAEPPVESPSSAAATLPNVGDPNSFLPIDPARFTKNALHTMQRLDRINNLPVVQAYVRLWQGEPGLSYHVCPTRRDQHTSTELNGKARKFMSGAHQVRDLVARVYSFFDVTPEAFFIMALESNYFMKNAAFLDSDERLPYNFCAKTSTACGPAQFIDGTARTIVERYNPYGLVFSFDAQFSRRVKRQGLRTGETDDRQYLVPSMMISALYLREIFHKYWDYPEFFPLAYHDGEGSGRRTRGYAGGSLQQTYCAATESTDDGYRRCMAQRLRDLRHNQYQTGLEDMLRFRTQVCNPSFDYTLQILTLRLAMRDLTRGDFPLAQAPSLANVHRPGASRFPEDYWRAPLTN
jgi:hypothetical protein